MAKAESYQTNAEFEKESLTSEIQDSKALIITLKTSLDELTTEKTSLEIQVEKYKEKEATKDQEIKTLQNHVSTLEIQVNGLKKDLSDSQISYRELLFKFKPEPNGELTTTKLELPLSGKSQQTTSTQIAITRTTAQTTSSSSYDVTSPGSPRISSQLTIDRKIGSKATSSSPSSPRMMSPRSPRVGQNSSTFGVQSKFG